MLRLLRISLGMLANSVFLEEYFFPKKEEYTAISNSSFLQEKRQSDMYAYPPLLHVTIVSQEYAIKVDGLYCYKNTRIP